MKVITAPYLGFCKGVEMALSRASEALRDAEGRNVYLFGELVHNRRVTEAFINEGAILIKKPEEAEAPGVVIVRAHGISDKDRASLLSRGLEIADCTCPVVLKGQEYVRGSSEKVIIIGLKDHSEVDSLYGSARGECFVVSDVKDLEGIEKGRYRGVVQTTFSTSTLATILEKGREKGIEINVVNSICNASALRRRGVMDVLPHVEAFVVVGDSHSANVRELLSKAESTGKRAFLVDSEESIPSEVYEYDIIGFTAGASTPREQYMKVKERLESHVK